MELIEPIFTRHFERLIDVTKVSIEMMADALDIKTPTVLQSELQYDRNAKKTDLNLTLTEAVGADTYLSGNGARKYMDVGVFREKGIGVMFQQFTPFHYPQPNAESFVEGLSILDMFFSLGFSEGKALFWENLQDNEQPEL
jgi:hypothetical protein